MRCQFAGRFGEYDKPSWVPNYNDCRHHNDYIQREGILKKTEAGLTLIELIAVMAILSIVVFVSANSLLSLFAGSVIQKQVYQTLIGLRSARHVASISNIPVSVTSQGCSVSYAYTTQPPSGQEMPLPQDAAQNQAIQCTGGVNGVWLPSGIFVSNLTSMAPTSQTLSFQNANGNSATIQLSAGGMLSP